MKTTQSFQKLANANLRDLLKTLKLESLRVLSKTRKSAYFYHFR